MNRRIQFAFAAIAAMCFNGPSIAGERFVSKEHGFSVEIPHRWVSVSPKVVGQINHGIRTFLKQNVSYLACLVPAGRTSSEFPRIMIQFQPWDGGIPTYDVLDEVLRRDIPGAVKKIKQDVDVPVQSLDIGNVTLDRAANRVTMRMQASVPGDGIVLGYSTGILGKDGMVLLHGYDKENRMSRTIPLLEIFADSFQFEPGKAYDQSLATVTTADSPSSGPWFSWTGAMSGGAKGALIGAGIGIIAVVARFVRRRMA